MHQELQILIGKNRLLSPAQKHVLLGKIKTASDEQIAELVKVFQGSNEKYKHVLIAKLKKLNLRTEKIKNAFKETKKVVLKERGKIIHSTEEEKAEELLEGELAKLEKPTPEKKRLIQRVWNKIIHFFKK
ncbi:hypothetical protein HOG48_05620 [Candidatus Peregrinibacteria bacterium]|jgi:hypothetical protein|nr:hypothetical protein [Candidatus Peregrinibacteria bacterium]